MKRRMTVVAWVVGISGAFALAWSFSPAARRPREAVPDPWGRKKPVDGCREGAWLPGEPGFDLICDADGRWQKFVAEGGD